MVKRPKTPPSHGGNRGSNPLGATTKMKSCNIKTRFFVKAGFIVLADDLWMLFRLKSEVIVAGIIRCASLAAVSCRRVCRFGRRLTDFPRSRDCIDKPLHWCYKTRRLTPSLF